MALYDIPAKKPVSKYADSHSSASKDSLVHTVSPNRIFYITDIVATNTSTSNSATVQLRYATSASSASASTVMKIIVPANATGSITNMKNGVKVPYGSGNKLYLYTNVSGAKVGITVTGYEE